MRQTGIRGRAWPWALVLVLAASAGVFLWQGEAAPAVADAKTVDVGRGTLHRTVVATGVIRPVVGAEIDVGCRTSGTVVELPVNVGDTVEAGDLLARLETTELDARIDQAKADLAVARAERGQVESALGRRRRLAAEGFLAPEELELAEKDLEVLRARVEDAAARLRVAEINRGYARIEAPIRGVIAEVTTRRGETVAASLAAPTFVTIIDLDRLEVRAYVDETDIGRVFVGQPATFTVDTYPEVELAAEVTAIEPQAELQNSVVNYIVVLDFEDRDDVVLRPEMTAHVRLELERREDVLTVPREALQRRDGRRYVSVRRDGTWTEQEVKTGWSTDHTIEVTDGLVEGETIRLHPL